MGPSADGSQHSIYARLPSVSPLGTLLLAARRDEPPKVGPFSPGRITMKLHALAVLSLVGLLGADTRERRRGQKGPEGTPGHLDRGVDGNGRQVPARRVATKNQAHDRGRRLHVRQRRGHPRRALQGRSHQGSQGTGHRHHARRRKRQGVSGQLQVRGRPDDSMHGTVERAAATRVYRQGGQRLRLEIWQRQQP